MMDTSQQDFERLAKRIVNEGKAPETAGVCGVGESTVRKWATGEMKYKSQKLRNVFAKDMRQILDPHAVDTDS